MLLGMESINLREKRPSEIVTVGWQNVTGAGPNSPTGVMMGCEVDKGSWRATYEKKQHYRWEFPDHDAKQAIAWDTRIWTSNHPIESIKIHGSSAGTESIPDGVRTPARWVHRKRLVNRRTGEVVSFIWSWWINSWNPMGGHDQWTDDRKKLAELAQEDTIRMCKRAEGDGDEIVVAGDFNSIRARLKFFGRLGLRTVHGRGLDRMYRSKGLKRMSKGTLEVVGVGPTMKHHGLRASLKITQSVRMAAEPMHNGGSEEGGGSDRG